MQTYKVYINNRVKIITDNWSQFCNRYKVVEAAGGVVYNNEKHLLMIFRNGKWDLPKGKLDIGEAIENCAIREVEEECGVTELNITEQLIDTYHIYSRNSEKILKHTYWFKMSTNCNKNLKPQIKEGITRACWVNKEDISKRYRNSFGNIKDLLDNELL